MDAIYKHDIEEAFRGRLWTYTPILTVKATIGVAIANEAGYTPISSHMTRDCGLLYEQAYEYCKQLNADRGQTEEASLDIVCSSMAQGKTA